MEDTLRILREHWSSVDSQQWREWGNSTVVRHTECSRRLMLIVFRLHENGFEVRRFYTDGRVHLDYIKGMTKGESLNNLVEVLGDDYISATFEKWGIEVKVK